MTMRRRGIDHRRSRRAAHAVGVTSAALRIRSGRSISNPPLKRMMRGGQPEENIDVCLRM